MLFFCQITGNNGTYRIYIMIILIANFDKNQHHIDGQFFGNIIRGQCSFLMYFWFIVLHASRVIIFRYYYEMAFESGRNRESSRFAFLHTS